MATSALGFANFYSQTLSASITDTDTTIALSSTSGLPNEGFLTIEPNSASNREIIYYTSKSGNNVVLPSVGAGRGVGGTTAVAHSSGVTIKMNTVAEMFEAMQDGTGLSTGFAMPADVVKSKNIDWADTGGGDEGGIWWEELGRTTLGSAGDTITVDSLSARKYLKISNYLIATGGTINQNLRFNNDSGSNYAQRKSDNGGADSSAGSLTSITLQDSTAATNSFYAGEIINVSAQEKLLIGFNSRNSTGAANPPARTESWGKWANTAAQITRIDIFNTGTGDFAIGSEVVVLGHD